MNRDQLIQEGRRKLSKFQQKKKETSLNDLDVLATDAIDFVERSSVQDLTANDQEVVKGFPDETAALCSNPQPNYQNPIIALPSSPHLTPNSQAISLESRYLYILLLQTTEQ
jgi:hypothetical protein